MYWKYNKYYNNITTCNLTCACIYVAKHFSLAHFKLHECPAACRSMQM